MKISIVTAVYNRAAVVGDAVRSVNAQSHPDVEHVFVDGASTDGSVQAIQAAGPRNPVLRSEKDSGIYDALNKGVGLASGDVIGLLHSDDVFADEAVLADVARQFADPQVNFVYGDLVYVAKDNLDRVFRHWRAGEYAPRRLRTGWMPPHPTVFMRASLYRQIGPFNTRYRIAADYELMLRCFLSQQVRHRYIPRTLVKMRVGGESNRSLERILRKSREDFSALRSQGFSLPGATQALALKNLLKLSQLF